MWLTSAVALVNLLLYLSHARPLIEQVFVPMVIAEEEDVVHEMGLTRYLTRGRPNSSPNTAVYSQSVNESVSQCVLQ